MILAASVICRNERGRYLPIFIDHLREFCDQITVLDDHSNDGTFEWLISESDAQLHVRSYTDGTFDEHEGRARQALTEFTLARAPTHVLAIDADEFVEDGLAVRKMIEGRQSQRLWSLQMCEVWNVNEHSLQIRADRLWRPHAVPVVWHAPDPSDIGPDWRIPDRQLACPRTPLAVRSLRAAEIGYSLFHFGWTDQTTRQERYDRYMRIDGGLFHNNRHLQSIMDSDRRIIFQQVPWPRERWSLLISEKLRGKDT